MRRVSRRLRAGIAGAALLVGAVWVWAEESPTAKPDDNWTELREKTFNTVWDTVNESYYDPQFGGVDWRAMREKYHAWLPKVTDKSSLNRLLMGMLGELRRTHFSILPREVAVFTPEERVRMGASGMEVAYAEGGVVVRAVKPGLTANIHPGDMIQTIEQVELAPLETKLREAQIPPARCGLYLTGLIEGRLRGAVGSKLLLGLSDSGGAEHQVELIVEPHEGDWSEPMGNFPSVPVQCSFQAGADGMVYLRFNVFARQAMKDIRAALKAVPPDGGLVIDLRGNPGGITLMASGISGWLSDHTFLLATMHMRQGHIGFTVSPQERAFLGPVALLIDSGSASTSEIMAAGLQEAGRARVFGEPSPGAALPSIFKMLPTGDLFQYAIADLQTPNGILIEGRGVTPDELVPCTRADLAAGRDPALEAARRWLDRERHKAPAAAPSHP